MRRCAPGDAGGEKKGVFLAKPVERERTKGHNCWSCSPVQGRDLEWDQVTVTVMADC